MAELIDNTIVHLAVVFDFFILGLGLDIGLCGDLGGGSLSVPAAVTAGWYIYC